jgi:hypothetical protein
MERMGIEYGTDMGIKCGTEWIWGYCRGWSPVASLRWDYAHFPWNFRDGTIHEYHEHRTVF